MIQRHSNYVALQVSLFLFSLKKGRRKKVGQIPQDRRIILQMQEDRREDQSADHKNRQSRYKRLIMSEDKQTDKSEQQTQQYISEHL